MIECLGVRGTFRTLVGINYILTTVVSKLFRGGRRSLEVLIKWGTYFVEYFHRRGFGKRVLRKFIRVRGKNSYIKVKRYLEA